MSFKKIKFNEKENHVIQKEKLHLLIYNLFPRLERFQGGGNDNPLQYY